jgi:hypothetical protein
MAQLYIPIQVGEFCLNKYRLKPFNFVGLVNEHHVHVDEGNPEYTTVVITSFEFDNFMCITGVTTI